MAGMNENTKKLLKNYEKTRSRKANGHFRKVHDPEAGLIIVTCLPTGMQYVSQSLNVWKRKNVITHGMRHRCMSTQALNDDIAQYGLHKFRVGIGETIRRMADETDAEYEGRLHTLYAEYIKGKTNVYPMLNMTRRLIPLYERKKIEHLGKLRGKQNQFIECACVYVITCTVSGKHYIGSTTDFDGRWRRLTADLGRGVFHCKELQDEYTLYGHTKFICEFVRLPEQDVREAKKIVAARFDNLYSDGRTKRT